MTNEKDLKVLEAKGITPEMFEQQLKRFETGFPWLEVKSVASVDNGIVRLDDKEVTRYLKTWRQFQQGGGTIEKFVPASGAASRMFKNIFAFVNSGRTAPETEFEKIYFQHIASFAFYEPLNRACKRLHNADVPQLIEQGRYVDVARAMLDSNGLNYGFLPKALLKFHKAVAGSVHTALEEHGEEGAQ